ncbi:MAG: Xaa-Pro dipeptidase [Solirubrobacteraceae bacterium]|nr:Xaa-Pro dipeptidase [Solirubrobacteraceae bacterium]
MDFNGALDAIERVDGGGVDLGGVEPASPDFPLDEYRRRWARVAALMAREGLDVLVLTQEEPIRYLSGYSSAIWATGQWFPGVLVVTPDPRDAVLVHSAFDTGCARGTAWVGELDGYLDAAEVGPKVVGHLRRVAGAAPRVGMEVHEASALALPWGVAQEIVAAAGPDLGDAGAIVGAVRMLKSEREIDRMRSLVAATVAGYRAGLGAARAGMTEKELIAIIASEMLAKGATAGTRPVFLNCVSGPERYPLVDATASDKPLRDGDLVFVDGGGGADGYMSDLIRIIAVGEISADHERYARAAEGATGAMVDAVAPGISVSELYEVGLAHFREAGVEAGAGGLFGHGIGTQLWERPLIKPHDDPAEDVTLRAGMTICVEPILAPQNADGTLAGILVFEEQVAVTADGCEVLSAGLPRTLARAPA